MFTLHILFFYQHVFALRICMLTLFPLDPNFVRIQGSYHFIRFSKKYLYYCAILERIVEICFYLLVHCVVFRRKRLGLDNYTRHNQNMHPLL